MNNKKPLFENVGGNKFKLISESFEPPQGTKLMREGLKKVFSSAGDKIPYKALTNVGLGYIKSVTEAVKYALEESQQLAPSYGFKDDEANQQFVKEDGEMSDYDRGNYENEPTAPNTNASSPEEKREVQIGKEISKYVNQIYSQGYDQHSMAGIAGLANELIRLHKSK
jgi:hypothetical protein